uniref:Vacuolar protein sorting-associated protein 28 homolog n=1 Tax=Caenorhabditis tropicalis TaxID=1561998 RepID=A0A1I7UZ18_9PELO
MTVSSATCRDLLEEIKRQHSERMGVILEQHYVQYCSLLGAYVTAIRDDVITRDRNQLMFDIASFEIGKFIEHQKTHPGQRGREFQLLVDIIHKSIGDKLNVF